MLVAWGQTPQVEMAVKKKKEASTGGPLTIPPHGDRERSQTQASTNLFKTSKL